MSICPVCKTDHSLPIADDNPNWLSDPIPTPAGTTGAKGTCCWSLAQLKELHTYWSVIASRLGVSIPTGFFTTSRLSGLSRDNITEIRIVVELCLAAAGLTISDYFQYDKYGNIHASSQTDWTDVNRASGVPTLSRKVSLRAIHIEELRRGTAGFLQTNVRTCIPSRTSLGYSGYSGTSGVALSNSYLVKYIPSGGFSGFSAYPGLSGYASSGVLEAKEASSYTEDLKYRPALINDSLFSLITEMPNGLGYIDPGTFGISGYYNPTLYATRAHGICLADCVIEGTSIFYNVYLSMACMPIVPGAISGYHPDNIGEDSWPVDLYHGHGLRGQVLGWLSNQDEINQTATLPITNSRLLAGLPSISTSNLLLKVGDTLYAVSRTSGSPQPAALLVSNSQIVFTGTIVQGTQVSLLVSIDSMLDMLLFDWELYTPENNREYRYRFPQYSEKYGLIYLKQPLAAYYKVCLSSVTASQDTITETYKVHKILGKSTGKFFFAGSLYAPASTMSPMEYSIDPDAALNTISYSYTRYKESHEKVCYYYPDDLSAFPALTLPYARPTLKYNTFKYSDGQIYRASIPGTNSPHRIGVLSRNAWVNVGGIPDTDPPESLYSKPTNCTCIFGTEFWAYATSVSYNGNSMTPGTGNRYWGYNPATPPFPAEYESPYTVELTYLHDGRYFPQCYVGMDSKLRGPTGVPPAPQTYYNTGGTHSFNIHFDRADTMTDIDRLLTYYYGISSIPYTDDISLEVNFG